MSKDFCLVVTIVDRKLTSNIMKMLEDQHKIKKSTIFLARGHSDTEGELFGMKIEPEREGILSIIPREKEEEILKAIETEGKLNEPGHGITFSLEVHNIKGFL
ncbi:P-II family nitrogen regulator [Alkalicoccus luteus]|uniref:P-II family nitrogen regulator n=1 Tax=Alkalicoccus luteus TaxID=1237094 RepID=UPI0040338B62